MAALKTLVIALGVLIVGATGFLVYEIVQRASGGAGIAGPSPAGRPALDTLLPHDAAIEDAMVSGDRLVVSAWRGEGERVLYIVDLADGRLIATVRAPGSNGAKTPAAP